MVDTARDPSLYGEVMALDQRAVCLFAGPLQPSLARTAPYLAILEPEDAFLRRWRETGRGQSWGVLFRSQADLAEMRRQLRQRLEVVLPDGRRVLFRFYDPRVLRDYLPGCQGAELDFWFGQTSVYWVDGERTGETLALRRSGDGVAVDSSLEAKAR
ncbi:MAG: hypothetical protein QOD89_1261 [Bradyrhizobium sp.]|jgi:hypothetical protein|nr:hypothetical protein [Bradyrhizobium sp.]